jgi:regulator of protease activity HflC (stomatin/prohibitin superfamily)
MATNNLKSILDQAGKTAGELSRWSHLTKHLVRRLYAGSDTVAPKTQASLVKSLNAMLKTSYQVEEVFPPKKAIRAAREKARMEAPFTPEAQAARAERLAEAERRKAEAEARAAAYRAKAAQAAAKVA